MDYEFTFEPRSDLELTRFGAIRVDIKEVGSYYTLTFRLVNLTDEKLEDLQSVVKKYLKANKLPFER